MDSNSALHNQFRQNFELHRATPPPKTPAKSQPNQITGAQEMNLKLAKIGKKLPLLWFAFSKFWASNLGVSQPIQPVSDVGVSRRLLTNPQKIHLGLVRSATDRWTDTNSDEPPTGIGSPILCPCDHLRHEQVFKYLSPLALLRG